MIGHPYRALLLLVVLMPGCVSGPLRTVEVGTVRNQALALYSFGGTPRFRVESNPVYVKVLAPAGALQLASAAARTDSGDATGAVVSGFEGAAIDAASTQSAYASSRDAAGVDWIDALGREAAASARSKVADAEAAATRRGDAERARAAADAELAKTQAGLDRSRWDTRETRGDAFDSARASRIEAGADAGRVDLFEEQSRLSATLAYAGESAAARAATSAATAGASLQQADYRRPVLHKSASKGKVLIEERFEFILELRNSSGLDLHEIEIEDELDERIRVDTARIYSPDGVGLEASLDGQDLTIVLRAGLPRGRGVRVHIPARVSQ